VTASPPVEYWTDPSCFAVGRRAGRCLVDRFDSLADLDAGTDTNRLDLAGEWDFQWVDGLVGFDGHAAAAAGPSGSARMPVPGLWQLHGYGNVRHAFTNPAADASTGVTVYNESANRRSWAAAQYFLSELFDT